MRLFSRRDRVFEHEWPAQSRVLDDSMDDESVDLFPRKWLIFFIAIVCFITVVAAFRGSVANIKRLFTPKHSTKGIR